MWRSQNMLSLFDLLYRGQTCDAHTSEKKYVKICVFDKDLMQADFIKEASNLKLANQFEIGPKLLNVKLEDDKGIMEMQDLTSDGFITLEKICEDFTDVEILDKVFQDNFLNMINLMLDSGFMHIDLNHGNIMVNQEKKVQLIDFAEVQFFDKSCLQNIHYKQIIPIPYLRIDEKLSLFEIVREAMTSFTGDMLECSTSVSSTLKNDETITKLVFETRT